MIRMLAEWIVALVCSQDPDALVLRTCGGMEADTFPAVEVPAGEIGIVTGGLPVRSKADVAAWSEIFPASGWTVLNAGWPDLAAVPEGLGELAKSDKLALLSANARAGGRAYVIRTAGGRKIAIIGATAPGGKVEGIADPSGAVAAALSEAAPRADIVVLVLHAGRDQAAEILRANPGIHLAVVSGRGSGDPEPLRIGGAWLVEAPWGGGLWGRIEIRFEGRAVSAVANRFGRPEGEPSSALLALRKKHGLTTDLGGDVAETAGKGETPVDRPSAAVAANRACRVRVLGVTERDAYGARKAAAGRRLLVVDAEFENLIPLTLVESHQVSTEYRIPNLADHAYVVVDRRRLSRLVRDADSLPGHVPVRDFKLQRLGSKLRGNMIFEIPKEGVDLLELRLYDYAHGHMFPPPLRGNASKVTDPEPLLEPGRNEVVEAGVYGLRKTRELGGAKAPEGMTFLEIEFLAKSRFTYEVDAGAFDPKAKQGDRLEIGAVADWKEARKHLHVVLDGEYMYSPAAGTKLAEEPRFIPDVATGDLLVFLVPEKYVSLELRCDFPNAQTPKGEVIHPAAIVLGLEGTRPELPEREAIAGVEDEVFAVSVVGQNLLEEFAAQKAGKGMRFLVLDVTVKNGGEAGEFFQTARQLRYATEKGGQIGLHRLSYAGPRPAAEIAWVPPGGRRTFQVVFEIPASERKLRLSYSGVSKAEILELKPIEGGGETPKKRACPKCKEPAAPDDEYCQSCGEKIGK
ncbi:MAG: hypothetical protein HYY17_01180 [Planctomycetes bacterium]|nr:hypothetical protein [Planctomycetota bacterium]